ncbi:MAG: hypothetical protein CW342_01940 [Thermoactinomycetaceae bacterium]|jgi:NTE family protein|nr:hypothetical protein [Bacillota bacterium]MBO2531653.1 hypothetical protein [Thermoactinomycetaceae bacterium]
MNDVGIALSGGGVAGCAHLGILYGLEKEKVPVRYIAGTSAGAVVAALYAYGYRPKHMTKLLPLINKELVDYDYPSFVRAFLRRGMQVQGLAKGERLRYLIAETTRNARMADLPFPVALIATDLKTARPVIFTSRPFLRPLPGADVITDIPVADAVVASCAIPVLFQPIRHRGRILVDGGVIDNCPISAVKALGAEKTIAVRTREAAPVESSFDSLLAIVKRVMSITLNNQLKQQLKEADIVLEPEVAPDTLLDFTQTIACVKCGYRHVRERMGEIRRVLGQAEEKVSL